MQSFLPHELISTSLGKTPGVSTCKKNIPGRGNSKCKGPEAGEALACSEKRKPGGLEWHGSNERVVGGEFGGSVEAS